MFDRASGIFKIFILLVSSVSLFSEAVFGCDALWLAVILLAVVTLVLASLFPPTGWTVT